ncbi:ABC transporter substrate-binding protein [Paracoccus sp. Ld10]|uniref:ABC transporter substrate-binding protein n=1 Tax=Paracoccus sp. Ld10 TaxID=649158 RepID=UPI00386B5CAA
MTNASLATRLAVTGAIPRRRMTEAGARIGILAPLSGPMAAWGGPGLNGCAIWAERINGQGGLTVGATRQRVTLIARDAAASPAAIRSAARDLVDHEGVRILLTLGGDSLAPALPWLMARSALVSTLLPFDLSPDTPSLIAPAEVHPLFVVTAVSWLATARPDLRRVALCSQTDMMGRPSLATYRAAFAAEGIGIVHQVQYDPAAPDAPAIVAAMLAHDPQILCWCSSDPPMVEALTEAAFLAGFGGPIISCTGDRYRRLVARTTAAFMENFIFNFPDFDDPALRERAFFSIGPSDFYDSFQRRFPGQWSAVSWEYASVLDLWQSAVEIARTTEPAHVLQVMKRGAQMMQLFGPARWGGEALFGVDNALIGSWPVVRVIGGKARIVTFGSVLDWLDRHEALLVAEMAGMGLLWHQRGGRAIIPPA